MKIAGRRVYPGRSEEGGTEASAASRPRDADPPRHLRSHGLPPTPAEIDAFVATQSPKAWEKLVDRLLASPHYGEQWGRHWLDVVRFAESDGYEYDTHRPDA